MPGDRADLLQCEYFFRDTSDGGTERRPRSRFPLTNPVA
jgi:hypothetical protein